MINLKSCKQRVIIRKTITDDDDTYLLLIQHKYTRIVDQFIVENVSVDPLYYEFEITMTADAPFGEYDFYVMPYDPGHEIKWNINDIKRSTFIDINPLKNLGSVLMNFGQVICNYNDILPGKRVTILTEGLMQYFNFESYKKYESERTYKAYERTK